MNGSMGSTPMPWFSVATASKQRILCRRHAFVLCRQVRSGSNVKSWLSTILRNIWLNQLRQRRAAPKIVDLDRNVSTADLVIDQAKDPYALYVSKVELEQIRAAILRLFLESRELIVLRECGELSYNELASILGCPIGTVMSRLARARSKPRALLSDGLSARSQCEEGGAECVAVRNTVRTCCFT